MTLSALHARYDGSIPANAAVSPDADAPYLTQLENRRDWAAKSVREQGRRCLHHHRAFWQTKDINHHHEWLKARKALAHALRGWAEYRAWAEAERARTATALSQAAE